MAPIQTLIVGSRNEKVPATIRKIDVMPDFLNWYAGWYPKLWDLSGAPLFPDSGWDVLKIWETADGDNRLRSILIEASEQIHGYIVFQIDGYIGIDGKPCLYVAFLSTAPWNRKRKGGDREYRGIGSTLLSVALLYELKYIGSLALELHSLPEAEEFYRKIGMYETGNKSAEGLKQMRMDKSKSLALLRKFKSSSENGGESDE